MNIARSHSVAVALMLAICAPCGFAQKADRKRPDELMEEGLAAESAGDNKKALAIFDEVLKSGPADPKALYHRGLAHGALGETAKALEDYNRAISLKFEYSPLFVARGSLLLKQG